MKPANIFHGLAIMLLVLVVSWPMLRTGFPYTHDGENHLARFANYKIAVKEGQIPPRFAPNLLNHYGYPVFNYNYPLANILSLPLSLLKIPYEISFKLLVIIGLIFGSFGIVQLAKTKAPNSTWLVSLLTFLSMPYLTSTIYVRGSIGELLAMTLIPWLVLSIEQPISKHTDFRSLLLRSFLWSAFFLSHNSTVLYIAPLLVFYILFLSLNIAQKWTYISKQFLPILIGGLLSLWFWLPAWFEREAVIVTQSQNQQAWSDHFVTFAQLLGTWVSFGFSYPGTIDSMSFGLGFMTLVLLLISWAMTITNILRSRNFSNQPIWYLLMVTLAILGQHAISQPIWRVLPLVGFIQFPWRLQLIVVVFTPIVAAILYQSLGKLGKTAIIVGLLTQLFFVSRFKPVDYFHRDQIDYDMFAQTSTTQNENRTPQFTYEMIGDWAPKAKVLTGFADIETITWTGSSRSYKANVTNNALITEPTMNFPGWYTNVIDLNTQKSQKAEYVSSPDIAGRIAYHLPQGNYLVTTRFTQMTPSRLLGNSVSLIAMFSLLSTFVWHEYKYWRTGEK